MEKKEPHILNKYDMTLPLYFFAFIGVSIFKTFHVIWFEVVNKLDYFVAACISLSIASIITQIYLSRLYYQIKVYKLLILSSLTAGLGIALSSITSSIWYSISSGFIIGVGLYILFNTFSEISSIIYSNSSTLTKTSVPIGIGKLVGILLGSSLIFINWLGSYSLPGTIVLGGALISFCWAHSIFSYSKIILNQSTGKEPNIINFNKFKELYNNYRDITLFIIILNFIGAVFLNILVPYFPIIMLRAEHSILEIGITLSLSTASAGVIQYIINKINFSRYLFLGFIISHIFLFSSLTLLIFPYNSTSISTAILIYFSSYGACGLFRRYIEIQTFPKIGMKDFATIANVSFLFGNIFGVSIGGYCFINHMDTYALYISTGILSINLLSGVVLLKKFLSHKLDEEHLEQTTKENHKTE